MVLLMSFKLTFRFSIIVNKLFSGLILLISITQLISCSSDISNPLAEEEIIDNDPDVIVNLPPTIFSIVVAPPSHDRALMGWSEAKDPENELVTYSIYLDGELVQDNQIERQFEFDNLSELTTYEVKIIAKDPQGNQSISTEPFTTVKYYLRFSKFYDFDDVFDPGGNVYSIIRTTVGEYIIAGSSHRPDSSGRQFFIMKIDDEGNEIWKYFYFYQIGDAMFFKITQLADQNFIVAAGNDLLKIDNDGILIWHKEIPGFGDGHDQSMKSIKEDLNGDLFLVGVKRSSDPNKNHAGALTKLDRLGNIIWDKEFNPLAFDTFDDLVITDTNSLIILGSTRIADQQVGSHDFWIVHVDNDGNIIWEKTLGDNRDDFPHQIISTSDGNYAFCGASFAASNYNASLFKIDSNGNMIFSSYYTPNNISNFSLTETHDGGFATTGFDFALNNSLTLLKYDNNGNVVWDKLFYIFNDYSLGDGILQTDDGGFIIAGTHDSTLNSGPGLKIWIIKTDPEGNYEIDNSPF